MRPRRSATRYALRLDQRRRALDAARELLVAGGYEAMTLEAVATRAHLSKSDLNLVADSRQQLAADVYSDAASFVFKAAQRCHKDSVGDALVRGIDAIVDALVDDPERAAILLADQVPPGRASGEARTATIQAMSELLRTCSPRPISRLHARIICGGVRELLGGLIGHESPSVIAADVTALCLVLRDGP